MRSLNITIKEFCDVVEGTTSLAPSFLVKNISSLEHAESRDLSVIFDPEDNSVFAPLSLKKIETSKAGVILASREVISGKNYVIVKDPLVALQKISDYIDTRKDKILQEIHATAVIDDFAVIEEDVFVGQNSVILSDAKIGCGTKISASVFIGKGCQIGCDVVIHPGARILARCIIGDNSIIHSGAVIGSDGFGYRVMKNGMRKVPHVGIVRIGRDVEIGANTCVDRSEFGETIIGDGVKIDNMVHIAHNVIVGAHTAILAHTGIAGSAVIGSGCQIGGQVAIKDHVTIGNGAKIVSKSAVMRNIQAGEIVCGIPSMPFSQWKRVMVSVSKLPDYIKEFKNIKKYFEKKKNGFFRRLFWG
jgi:UDP-3-O-[3-hydroxymyristoyl] glucosamine N-acyltransferase